MHSSSGISSINNTAAHMINCFMFNILFYTSNSFLIIKLQQQLKGPEKISKMDYVAGGKKKKINFQDLPDLVLFEIMAKLPIEDLTNMYVIGTEKIRIICSHPMVLKHQHFSFLDILRLYLLGGDSAKEFLCLPTVLKRLGGYVLLTETFSHLDYTDQGR